MGVIFSAIMAIATFAMAMHNAHMQRKRQKKMEKEAEARADAAKGFTVATENSSEALGIAYGRNLVGGVRVFHSSEGNYNHAEPGPNGSAFINGLSGSVKGTKHEFLYIQQVLCVGGINRVVAIDVDGRPHFDDKFHSYGGEDADQTGRVPGRGALRIHAYTDGGVADPMMVANASVRADAKFTNCAYMTGVFRINRDNPQFAGVPSVQAYIEGRKIHTITGPKGARTLSTNRTYSNNPALCLLDYLIDGNYGRGLALSFIDLDTFYEASLICDRVVVSDVVKAGRFWSGVSGPRNVKLFEANVTLSTSNTIRDNIETLLETMGLAELIWSSGKYKLSLFYPELYDSSRTYGLNDVIQYAPTPADRDILRSTASNNKSSPVTGNWARDVISAYITDDDIALSEEVSIAWPNAQARYNFVTVKFLNESTDFVEDSVSWPPKTGTVDGPSELKGVWSNTGVYNKSDRVTCDGVMYQLANGVNYTSATPPGTDPLWLLFNEASVYNTYRKEDGGLPLETEFFEAGTTDYFHALAKAEQRCRSSRVATVYNMTLLRNKVDLEPGDLIRVNSESLSIPNEILRIEEATLSQEGNLTISAVKFDARVLAWNAPDTEVVNIPVMLNQDIGQARSLSFSPSNTDVYLSAGTLSWLRPDDARVTSYEVKYTTTPAGAITADTQWKSLGVVTWTSMNIPAIIGGSYTLAVVSMTASGRAAPQDKPATGSKWPIVTVGIQPIEINSITLLNVNVFKMAVAKPEKPIGGAFDFNELSFSVLPSGWVGAPPAGNSTLWVSNAVAQTEGARGQDTTLSWSEPVVYLNTSMSVQLDPPTIGILQDEKGTNFGYGAASGRYLAYAGVSELTTTDETNYSIVSASNCNATIINTGVDKGKYTISSLVGDLGVVRVRVAFRGQTYDRDVIVVALRQGYIRDLTPPPTPTGIVLTASLSNIFLKVPARTYTEGHGHSHTEVWRAQGTSQPFSMATKVLDMYGEASSVFVGFGQASTFFFKNVSVDGIESPTSAAQNATSGKIGNNDLGPLIIQAGHLADGSISGPKLQANSIAVGTAAIQDGAIVNAMIGDAAIDSAQIAAAAITTAKIEDAAITSAKIANLAVTDAKIAGVIQSNATDGYGRPLWKLDKDGTLELNTAGNQGRLEQRGGYIKVFDATGAKRVQIGNLLL